MRNEVTSTRTVKVGLAIVGIAAAGLAFAAEGGSGSGSGNVETIGNGLNVTGFVRYEGAFNTADKADVFNQLGNVFNGVPVTRTSPLGTDTVTRPIPKSYNHVNVNDARLQIDLEDRFSQSLLLRGSLRGYFNLQGLTEFDPDKTGLNSSTVTAPQYGLLPAFHPDGLSKAWGNNYGRPSFFSTQGLSGGQHGSVLEVATKDFMMDLPSLYLDYNSGPLWLRFGNQTIAWGEAIFFRVLDVPNGLDLRRHSALDFASEEFSDKRVPAPGLRGSYRVSDNLEIEGFTQKFAPTIYSNPNTPYNAIASQFTIHDLYSDTADNKWNFGLRVRGQVGDVGLQGIAVSRYNPDGVYRWTECTGPYCIRDSAGVATAYESDPTGVYSANEWFTYAGFARLNGVTGLNASINEFPAAQHLGAVPVGTVPQAYGELNYFFQALGPLRGHLAREYKHENILGLGANYVTTGAPNSVLDQLILRLEGSYTPKRTFTSPTLTHAFEDHPEWISAFVMEKYQRFVQSFPATYLVFQYMHRSQTDIFGRLTSGMGGDVSHAAPGYSGGSNYVAFALQQPFPNLVWRFDMAILHDMKGGILWQPAVRWKPNKTLTVEAFYNYIEGGGTNDNALQSFDNIREATIRLGVQF